MTQPITIVIATVGRADALEVCLRSLAAQTAMPGDVQVVHSGSDVETRLICERSEWNDSGLQVCYHVYPHKSAALQRDFAVRRTAQPLIMFADDDMEFEPTWIEALVGPLAQRPDVGATMGAVVNQPLSTPTPLWRVYRRLVARPARAVMPGAVLGALVQNGFPAGATEPIPAEWLTGMATMVRKEAYLSVNGFAPYHRGSSPGEDLDLGYRISRKWRILYVPAARCTHHQAGHGRDDVVRYQYLWMRSRFAFCRSSAQKSVMVSLWHIYLWAAFQTVSELVQLRRGRLRSGFLGACFGRLRGGLSCVGWNPALETFPEWHHRPDA